MVWNYGQGYSFTPVKEPQRKILRCTLFSSASFPLLQLGEALLAGVQKVFQAASIAVEFSKIAPSASGAASGHVLAGVCQQRMRNRFSFLRSG